MRSRDAELQRAHQRFEVVGDFVGWRAGRKSNRGADAYGNFAKVREAAVLALHLPDAVQSHRDNRDAKIFGEEADAALERSHAAIFGIIDFAFGKDQHAVAAVDRFAGKAETFSKAGKLRQRANVEQQAGKPVAEMVGPAPGEKPITRRTAHVF